MKKYLIHIALICVVGAIIYSFNLHNHLFWDDDDWIINNPYIHNFSWNNIKFIFTHDTLAGIGLKSNYYRPFLFLTFMFNYVIAGTQPLIYHLINNFFHITNAVILFGIIDYFFKKRRMAIVASLLFLIHPLQTEAVTYISGRGDPMSVFFMLWALILFLIFEKKKKFYFYVFSLLSLILAILSRETAFLFPVYMMVFLTSFVYKNNFWQDIKKSIVKSLPYFGISLFYGILRLTILNFQNTLNFYQQSNVYTEHLVYRIYTFLHVILIYFRLIIWPTGLHMNRTTYVSTSFFHLSVLGGFVSVAAILIFLIFLYTKNHPDFRIWFFSWGFFFVNLMPTSGIFPINALIYEHWLYFSLLGLFTLVAYYFDMLLDFLAKKKAIISYVLILILVIYGAFLSFQTVNRNIAWADTVKFYLDILKYEDDVAVMNNLANYYSDRGRDKEAEDLLWQAVKISDIQPAPYYNLGNILNNRKDYVGAIELYKKAVEVDPGFPFAYLNLAATYARQGNLTEALSNLKKLNQLEPENPSVYYNIGLVDKEIGDYAEARQYLEKGLSLTNDSSAQDMFKKLLNQLKK